MDKKVKVYSTPTCPWCIRAKQFLKENNIVFLDVDVSLDQAASEEMIQKSGQMGVPVLDIDGEIIVGFDKDKIRQALGIQNV
jgi:glutaredoxin-like YruB-family protein